MGKKDKGDKAKLDAKKARQLAKQDKASSKRSKKELKQSGEADIEEILRSYAHQESLKTSVTITNCSQPSPRANCSMAAMGTNNSDFLLFGGEFCDGEKTEMYNDLFRWNVERNEWRKIESVNTPPPRCSHQSICHNNKMYMFGGEYATLDQFHHYKDFWELDVKTGVWREIVSNNSSQDEIFRAPTPRSGHRMVIWRGYLLLYGGFYEAGKESRWFSDCYLFSFQEERWMRIPYKPYTQFPRPRSAVQMCINPLDDCLYVFGGYCKEKKSVAVPNSSSAKATAQPTAAKVEGRIFDDFWQLDLKPMLSGDSGIDVTKAVWQKISRKGDYPSARCGATMAYHKNKIVMFGGVFAEEGPRHSLVSTFYDDIFAYDFEKKRWFQLSLKSSKIKSDANSAGNSLKGTVDMDNIASNKLQGGADDDEDVNFDDSEVFINEAAEIMKTIDVNESTITNSKMSTVDANEVVLQAAGGSQTVSETIESNEKSIDQDRSKESVVAKYFNSLISPCPRINPAMILKGNTMFIYGGMMDLGDIEITLDDCWSLDLNKRGSWRKLLPGTMHTLVWKGVIDDDDSTVDGDDESNSDEDESDNGSDSDEDNSRKIDVIRSELGATEISAEYESLMNSVQLLSNQYGLDNPACSPISGEALRDFYSRTANHWTTTILDEAKGAEISEKDLKRLAFARADEHYQQCLPKLKHIEELESQLLAEDRNDGDKERKSKKEKSNSMKGVRGKRRM